LAVGLYVILIIIAILGAIVFFRQQQFIGAESLGDEEEVQDHITEGEWGKHTIYLFPHEEEQFNKTSRKVKKAAMKAQQKLISKGILWILENGNGERALVDRKELLRRKMITHQTKPQVIHDENAVMTPMLQHEL